MTTPRPLIGIVPGYLPVDQTVTLRSHYTDAVIAAGGTPFVLPIAKDLSVYERLLPLCDGFLLTGGSDIDPARYGESPSSERLYDISPAREAMETLVLSHASAHDVPTLGICRGMQMINVFFGGTLYQDLGESYVPTNLHPNDTPALGRGKPAGDPAVEALDGDAEAIDHWQARDYAVPTHLAYVVAHSRLAAIVRSPVLAVNSIHHQGVREVAPRLRAVAYASDGLVEAVEARDRGFILGVQWHPEFAPERPAMGAVFDALVGEAAQVAARRADGATRFVPVEAGTRTRPDAASGRAAAGHP